LLQVDSDLVDENKETIIVDNLGIIILSSGSAMASSQIQPISDNYGVEPGNTLSYSLMVPKSFLVI
jgi:hypothetical protein